MSINEAQKTFTEAQEEAMEWFKNEIATLRSGRIKPDMVTNLQVEHYGSRNPLQSLASVASSDARTLVVSPWDKSAITAIEKAITDADLGVNPSVDGDVIRLSFPSLTDDVRERTLKTLHQKAEDARIRMRQGRDDALKSLKAEKGSGAITEDDFFNGRKQLDEAIDAANNELDTIISRKKDEIEEV